MSKPQHIAILCSDIHLSAKAPIARSAEEDWFAAMRRPIQEMTHAMLELDVPVICSGDIFDKWNPPPEVINFAMDVLPTMYAIPGQHDLPFHRYEDRHRSAYGTLVRSGHIVEIDLASKDAGAQRDIGGLRLWGFPWGVPITPCPMKREKGIVDLAVIHAYCWRKGKGYLGASADSRVSAYAASLTGYHTAVFGDNHQGFLGTAGDCIVYNNGGFMLRKSDERTRRPHFGILMSDGSVDIQYLNTSMDRWIDVDKAEILEGEAFNADAFIKELNTLDAVATDYKSAVKQYMDTYEISAGARKIILESLEK